jgi:5-methylcytosine-specific restriction enzyme subunit McrC
MLSYAFKSLQGNGYKNFATEKFNNTAELCAAILCKGISSQLKRGLEKEYIPKDEELSVLRGKIDIAQSVKTKSVLRKKLVCNYDEFTENSYMNRIIKSTVLILLKGDISKSLKKELRKLMVFFSEVEAIELSSINWNIRYNRNNMTYRMLIGICYLVIKGLLQNKVDEKIKLMDFFDEQRMCRLYEKFILEYYKKEFPQIKVSASQIPWQLDDGISDMLPIMQSDIMLEYGDKVLIIDAKYYNHNTQMRYDKYTLLSGNLYQIFTYVKNKEAQLSGKPHEVSGMLLYAKTDEIIQPDNDYMMSGNKISVKTLDLNQNFKFIAEYLDNIVTNNFIKLNKNKDF